ncbi:MAG TPA: CpsD/CapB family tyrosine-protein kinase [Terriglobales bacterium]|nr:CpsD/CapB family tyrosine-protein kinase [Terriglobales bacterium]
MSRNFELLHQLQGSTKSDVYPNVLSTPAAPETAGEKSRLMPLERATDPLTAREFEEEKLVHRLFLDVQPSPRVVVFAGLDAGSGATSLCSRAAELLAFKTTSSVCLVDANLRSPSLHHSFGIENQAGLVDALLEVGEIRSYARQLAKERLWLVTAGTEVPDAHTLLASDRLAGYMVELRRNFDYVLIDSPAASLYTDSIVLGSMSDGVALVLKANVSRRAIANKIVKDFAGARVPVLGAVLNQRTFPVPSAIYSRL